MAKIIKIKYNGKTTRFPYPETPIKDFLEVVRLDFQIGGTYVLHLFEGDERLTESHKLEELGIKESTELLLTATIANLVKVQTILGQIYEFQFGDEATVKDLYDAISSRIKFTSTLPLLFNHRMHIFQSAKFFAEPLINLLKLTTITDEYIPHFYLFEFDLMFEPRKYEYIKHLKDLFLVDDMWQPKSGKQTSQALQIYLNSLYALTRVFSAEKEVDFDSIHNFYLPQFLIVLRQCLFPPACLAFKHTTEGALFNFEKSLLSEAFFHLFRRLLPTNIPDSELFLYTPHIFYHIFQRGDYSSTESADYENVELSQLTKSQNGATQTTTTLDKFFMEPVRLLNNKIVNSAGERFVLAEYSEICGNPNLTAVDYQRQSDLISLLGIMRQSYESPSNDTSKHSNLFETYSSHYSIWLPNTTVPWRSISNVSEQRASLQTLSDKDLKDIIDQLSKDDLFSIFTFAQPSKLSKYNHAQFVLLKTGSIVYIKHAAKCENDSFLCFDPLNSVETFSKHQLASEEVLARQPAFIVRENAADIRKIEQITCILFDVSGSMHVMVGNEGNKHTLLELSTMAIGAWRDRLVSYKLPHALGLIYFGADNDVRLAPLNQLLSHLFRPQNPGTRTDNRIVLPCNITRDLSRFETALANRPNCGYETPLYDAIDMAITTIRSFCCKNQSRLSPTRKDLILCLTDGSDTCSKISKADVLQKLLSENIVFDAINFDSKSDAVLIEFCEKTKGYYYENIQHSQTSMLTLFEFEASISVQDRDENTYGKVDNPRRRQPKLLQKPAVASKQALLGDGRSSSIAIKRILLEINSLNKKEMKNFQLFISKENIFFWKVIMQGETGTPYADGCWLLSIEFPPFYPQQPPDIRFITKIYHCNINDDGKICHDILNTAWSQKTSMYNIFMEILRLLKEPNPDDALSSLKGAVCKESKENYENMIIEWRKSYASASVEQLKAKYFLE